MDAGRPPQTVKPVSGNGLNEHARARRVVRRVGPAAAIPRRRRRPTARRGRRRSTSAKPASSSSARASHVRSKSAMRWPVSALMAAVGRGRLEDAGGGGQDRVLPVLRLGHHLGDLLHAGAGDVADAPARGVDRPGLRRAARPRARRSPPPPRARAPRVRSTLPSTAPISAATAPSTPGASGSQIRILVSTRSLPPLPGQSGFATLSGPWPCGPPPAWCSRRCRRRCP